VDYRPIVTIEPRKRGGKPCIRGLRITVYDVLEYLASGMSEAEILADFPDLTSDDIRACLAFAADRERRLLSIPGRLKLLFDQNLAPRLVARLVDVGGQTAGQLDVANWLPAQTSEQSRWLHPIAPTTRRASAAADRAAIMSDPR
jgi:uncharacterized protein (DUF433 family)